MNMKDNEKQKVANSYSKNPQFQKKINVAIDKLLIDKKSNNQYKWLLYSINRKV